MSGATRWSDPEFVRCEMEYREDAWRAQSDRDRADYEAEYTPPTRPTEPYRVEMWAVGRRSEAPHVVTVVADHPEAAEFAAAAQLHGTAGLYEDVYAQPVARWQAAQVATEEGRAR